MASKAYELITQVKDICVVSGTTEDTKILKILNLVQWNIYNTNAKWRALEGYPSVYTTELMTLDVAPATTWSVGNTITGATSTITCVIVEVLTSTTYNVKDRSGAFTLGEILSNGTYTANQGATYPTFSSNSHVTVPSTLAMIYDVRQTSTSPYDSLEYIEPKRFHESVPQPSAMSEGPPAYYTWWGGRLWLFPIPDATYTLTLYGYNKPVSMKLYSTGTAAPVTTAVTGTDTFFLNNANVDTAMFFSMTDDIRSDGTLPWSTITTVTSNTVLVISSYTGADTTGTYVCSSASSYTEDFDLLLVYGASIIFGARLREFDTKMMDWLKEQYAICMGALIETQSYVPDFTPIFEDFTPSGRVTDSAYKYPFLKGD